MMRLVATKTLATNGGAEVVGVIRDTHFETHMKWDDVDFKFISAPEICESLKKRFKTNRNLHWVDASKYWLPMKALFIFMSLAAAVCFFYWWAKLIIWVCFVKKHYFTCCCVLCLGRWMQAAESRAKIVVRRMGMKTRQAETLAPSWFSTQEQNKVRTIYMYRKQKYNMIWSGAHIRLRLWFSEFDMCLATNNTYIYTLCTPVKWYMKWRGNKTDFSQFDGIRRKCATLQTTEEYLLLSSNFHVACFKSICIWDFIYNFASVGILGSDVFK